VDLWANITKKQTPRKHRKDGLDWDWVLLSGLVMRRSQSNLKIIPFFRRKIRFASDAVEHYRL
jgi:hypothetical protein